MKKFDTGLNEHSREEVVKCLSRVQASTFTLYLKTHYFHWNVTGLLFPMLHELFEKQYEELLEAVDKLAERIRSLGYPAPGSYTQFQELSFIDEANDLPRAKEMIHQLLTDHETIIRNLREFFTIAEKSKDDASADLMNERLDVHEKTAWMLRSMLEE